jgi:hypothetical protein
MRRISSSGRGHPDRFKLDQPASPVLPGRHWTKLNCNPRRVAARGLSDACSRPCALVIYALRVRLHALLAGSKPVLASSSQGAAAGGRWLLMAIRGHLGARACNAWARSLVERRRRTTVRFSGRTYSKLPGIVRALCAVVGRCRLPVVAAVAVTVAVNQVEGLQHCLWSVIRHGRGC